MKIKLNSAFFYFRKRPLIALLNSFILLSFTSVFGLPTNITNKENKVEVSIQQLLVTGVVKDDQGLSLPGANVVEKGTKNSAQTDIDGKFTIKLSKPNAVLIVSFIGFTTKEINVNNQKNITINLKEDSGKQLDEVIIVGYGTRKKATVTSAVTQIGTEVFENRPVANATAALQGAVGNLVISNSANGGEPGSEPNINIRGLITSATGSLSDSGPLVIIDGAVMSISQINPEDIETVTVLKDAASAAIYGSRAAGGAILITTKSGKKMNGGMKISYTNNSSLAQPTKWPNQASAINFAYAMNDAALNQGSAAYYTEQELTWIQQNMANPGSAPTLIPSTDNKSWDQTNFGLGATGSTNWKDFLFVDWAMRYKHDFSFKGGDEKLNYYISAGTYTEDGLLKTTKNTYSRYNLDAKIAAKPKKWLAFELLTKASKSKSEYPWDSTYGRGRVFDILSKLKPTLPTVDPYWGEPLAQAAYPGWDYSREKNENNQISLMPRVTLEPIKDWFINLQYNYTRNNNNQIFSSAEQLWKLPDGSVGTVTSRSQTVITPSLDTNEYFSPNLYTTYSKSFKNHNFDATVGYQSEEYNLYNLSGSASNVLTDNVQSVSTAVGLNGVKSFDDEIYHWATESVFGRIGYNYKEKYIARATYRRDGSSKFEPGKRLSGFPSFELGYNIAKEDFWPVKDISMFKLRASKGSLGNQNVSNYLWVPTMDITQGTFLFNGTRQYYVSPPDITSLNLTWETVKTSDVGIDILALRNRLGFTFDWYRSDTYNMASTGQALPNVLGTAEPLTNAGSTRVQGWEAELSWNHKVGDFHYNAKIVLSDYKQTVLDFPNAANLVSGYYAGKDLGEVWGLTWEGWFKTTAEATERNARIDQTWVYGTTTNNFGPGDAKYADIDGNGKINNGTNTVGDTGDFKVIGNTTPRYQYGVTLGCDYKGFDFSMFIQGIGKKDVAINTTGQFTGPAQGPLHANVLEEHLDYFRPEDTTSPLGPNTDSYFARPYAVAANRNNRNYRFNTDHFIQNGAYTRLKNVQIGFTIPKYITDKCKIDRIRLFVSAENLFTISHLMFYDPETIKGEFSNASSYPLSRVISTGLNVSF